MPLIHKSSFQSPFLLQNGHVATIVTNTLRRPLGLEYSERERISTSDGDFLDVDIVRCDKKRKGYRHAVAILLHGLEGSSKAHYIKGTCEQLLNAGFDCVAMNLRGCSGEPNLTLRSYHSGATDDLQTVVRWAESYFPNQSIVLVGFSLGGNIVLKYIGDGFRRLSVVAGVGVSVPCDLAGSAKVLEGMIQRIYMQKFMCGLVGKLKTKNKTIGSDFKIWRFRFMRTFAQFDGAYTAPVHGFGTAENYWKQCSSLQFFENISIPTLLINARNDPFLSESCFPRGIAEKSRNFYLEIPESGGHVGFLDSISGRDTCWCERRIAEFLSDQVKMSLPG